MILLGYYSTIMIMKRVESIIAQSRQTQGQVAGKYAFELQLQPRARLIEANADKMAPSDVPR